MIDGVLGEGGMGVVYRAHRPASEIRCAVKTIRDVEAKRVEFLRREIRALVALRHPGIVRVLDEGIEDGRPWYAMELLEPVTFASVLHSTWAGGAAPTIDHADSVTRMVDVSPARGVEGLGGSAPGAVPAYVPSAGHGQFRELVATIQRLCLPLAVLHGEGLVHCDLKPSNIFLRADGTPVIGDFGLASYAVGARGRAVLDVNNEIRGTYFYMSPEQIRGEELDARTDLYALGCILYEVVTGRPPFVGSTPQVIAGHLSEEPQPTSALVRDVPAGLDTLIHRLLEKEPRHRIGFADDVATMLTAACGVALPATSEPAPRHYVYRSQLVGRDSDLARFARWTAEASGRKGRLALVGGESGVGKTRLSAEAGRRAALTGMFVIAGQCSAPTVGRAPLEPLLPLLRAVADQCVEGGAEAQARVLAERGPVLAPFEPSLASLPGAEAWPLPARLDPDAGRRRLFDALFETMKVVAGPYGLVLIVDDLQWADELSLAALTNITARLASTNILIVGTYRTDEAGPSLDGLLTIAGTETLRLGRLGESGVSSMVADMLAMSEPSPSFVRFLTRESEGNPFFVAEYLRAAIAEGVLARDDAGRWRLGVMYSLSDDAFEDALRLLPTSIRELVALRCQGLSAAAREVLQIASVLGNDVEPSLLGRAIGLAPERAMDGVRELIAREVLEESVGRLRFAHHKLLEFSYDEIPAGDRVDLHRSAAHAMERLDPDMFDVARQAELARHWSLADEPERALAQYRLAARQAVAVYANAQAADYYAHALTEFERLPGGGESRIAAELHEALGDVLARSGRLAEARDAYGFALDLTDPSERVRRATLYQKTGKAWETHHTHVEALSSYDRAIEALGGEPEAGSSARSEVWVGIHLDRMLVHYWRGAADLMEAELDAVKPRIGHAAPALQAAYYEGLANLGFRRERYLLSADTLRYAQRMHEAGVASQDPARIAETQFELGFTQLFHGDTTAAAHTLRDACDLARKIGDVTRLIRSLTYLAVCERRRGHIEEVERYAGQCLPAAQESGMAVYVGTSQANLAWADFSRGSRSAAEERCRSALEQWQHMDAAFPFFWLAAFPLLAIRFARGDLPEAVRLARVLLRPDQQRLPDQLAEPLGDAVAAGGRPRDADVRRAIVQALRVAADTRFL